MTVFLCKFESTLVKQDMVSIRADFVYELTNELSNNLRPRTIEIIKTENWVGTEPSVQCPLQK